MCACVRACVCLCVGAAAFACVCVFVIVWCRCPARVGIDAFCSQFSHECFHTVRTRQPEATALWVWLRRSVDERARRAFCCMLVVGVVCAEIGDTTRILIIVHTYILQQRSLRDSVKRLINGHRPRRPPFGRGPIVLHELGARVPLAIGVLTHLVRLWVRLRACLGLWSITGLSSG